MLINQCGINANLSADKKQQKPAFKRLIIQKQVRNEMIQALLRLEKRAHNEKLLYPVNNTLIKRIGRFIKSNQNKKIVLTKDNWLNPENYKTGLAHNFLEAMEKVNELSNKKKVDVVMTKSENQIDTFTKYVMDIKIQNYRAVACSPRKMKSFQCSTLKDKDGIYGVPKLLHNLEHTNYMLTRGVGANNTEKYCNRMTEFKDKIQDKIARKISDLNYKMFAEE